MITRNVNGRQRKRDVDPGVPLPWEPRHVPGPTVISSR